MDDDPCFSHPDFGTREEDWPDPDVDSDTEEGRESMRVSEAALLATINRSIAQRQQQLEVPGIPDTLYVKAQDHQDQLTDEERRLLLSRGDMIGRVLASPDSLSIDEVYEFMHWPPPNVVRDNIQRATGGTLSTPAELCAKVKDAIGRGRLETSLSEEAIGLIPRRFHAEGSTAHTPSAFMAVIFVPGREQAANLLQDRLGLDSEVFKACVVYISQQPRKSHWASYSTALRPVDHILSSLELIVADCRIGSESDQDIIAANWLVLEALQNAIVEGPSPRAALEEMITSMKSLKEQYLLGNMTVKEVMERTWDCLWSCRYNSFMSPPAPAPDPAVESLENDRYPTSLWPPDSELQTPVRIFARASNLSGDAVVPAWRGLSEDQKEPYRAQYETTRRAAWTARGSPAPDEGHTMQYIRLPHDLDYPISPRDELFRPPMSPRKISAVQVFHDELGGQLELAETLARWQTLPVAQMGLYEARARELDAEQRSAFPARLRHYENYSY